MSERYREREDPHGNNPVGETLILHRLGEQDKKLDLLVEHLTGNGDPSKGLIVRVNNVERDVGFAKWLATGSVGSVLAAAGTWVWTRMSGGHP